MKQAFHGLLSVKGLKNNYLSLVILAALFICSFNAHAQYGRDSTRKIQVVPSPFIWPGGGFSNFLKIPSTGQLPNLPYSDSGSIAYFNSVVYVWNGTDWNPTGSGGGFAAADTINVIYPLYILRKDSTGAPHDAIAYLGGSGGGSTNAFDTGYINSDSTIFTLKNKSSGRSVSFSISGGSSSGISGISKLGIGYALTKINDSTYNVDTSIVQSKAGNTTLLALKEPTINGSNAIKNYWNGYKKFASLGSDSLTEQTDNLFFTLSRSRNAVTLATAGNSGVATYNSATGLFNIPNYTLAGLGGIGLTGLSASAPLSYNNTTGAFSITQSNASTPGYLSAADWNAFNGKIDSLRRLPGSKNVEARKNGVWTTQFIDSTGGGSSTPAIRTVTTNTSYTNTDVTLLIDTSAGNVTVTLDPTIGTFIGYIKKISSDANQVIISMASGTIDGASSKNLVTQYETVKFQFNLTNAYILY